DEEMTPRFSKARSTRRDVVWHACAAMVALASLGAARGACAQAVSFDEAIFSSGEAPAALAPRRALAAREAADAKIRGTAQATVINAAPGFRFRPDAERGFEGQFSANQGWNLAGLGAAR